ncbi:family with sequence similarity 189 member B [Phyllostomus discolor]|uniref:Family with sequence similarity 189 member B n=1 Tax=Phyllostomus discolor TaxID=89673 RepID=A0A833YJN9_9CHIR|nr:family with sequence similarity 189 member B [Phyllostomus discolor]
MMPSPSDSSRSLTSRPSTWGLTHLRLHRPWLQALLTLGLAQVLLGILVVTFSMISSSVTTTESIKRSCPSWAGFSLAFSGVVGIVSWKRPFTLVNLLFSVCGLTVCACIICSLSAVICCIQIFSLDLVHSQLAPEHSVSGPLGPLGCTSSPPAPLLHTMLDLEEFVPPVPPPPYYPPEYTCSSETDAQSITYNGSMDSPVPLYPTDCPPSYEAVMGLRGDSQATLFDPQLHDGSCICERVASIVDVSMDSGSLVLSAIGDLPGGSSPSEDSCLLELQGSVRSVDYVLFRSIQRSRAGYCLSLDCGLRGPFEDSPLPRRPPRAARSYSCSAPEAPPPLGAPTAARSCHRLEGWPPWVGPCFPELRRRVPKGGSRPAAAPPTRAPTRRFSDSSGSLTPPGHRPPHPAPPSPLLLPRSHSDPGITTSSDTADFRDLYTKVLEEETASVSSADTGLCSEACLFRLARCPSPKLLRARSAEKRRPVPTYQKVPLPSGPAPAHSLGDLKSSWPGRGLVTRFLQMSRKAPDPSGNGARGHKQVPQSPWGRPGRENLHLRSCGDLSSSSSLRRLLSARRLERGTRPHSLSLNGGSRETGL